MVQIRSDLKATPLRNQPCFFLGQFWKSAYLINTDASKQTESCAANPVYARSRDRKPVFFLFPSYSGIFTKAVIKGRASSKQMKTDYYRVCKLTCLNNMSYWKDTLNL